VQTVWRRLPYASNELSVNAASLAAAIARQGPDNYATRIWWDKP
jgi:Susd and RagB outer membrane lipoprotein